MEYIKLQKKILDNFIKNNHEFNSQVVDDLVYVMDNRHQIFVFPKDEFYLDLTKLMDGKDSINFKKFFDIEGEDGVLTGEMKIVGKNITVVKIKSEKNHSWVDKKLLDRWGIKHELHFTVPPSTKHPLLVWEDEMLCGVILPVYVKEDDNNATI